MPAITPTTTTTTLTQQQQQQQETTFDDDDGHYTDIHVSSVARIATWRRSFIDEPGHYDYIEFNQPTEQATRPTGGYEGLDPAAVAALLQPAAPHEYESMRINAADTSHVTNTDPDDRNHTEYEGLDPASLSEPSAPHEYAGIGGSRPT